MPVVLGIKAKFKANNEARPSLKFTVNNDMSKLPLSKVARLHPTPFHLEHSFCFMTFCKKVLDNIEH